VRRLDDGNRYSTVGTVAGEMAWADVMGSEDVADVLRSALRDDYADASDEEISDALENVLDSMSAAEGFSFGSALRQIGNSAGKLASDPAFAQIVRTAAPIAGGALGTFIGGPLGTAVGTQLGNLAVKALPPVPGAARPPAPAAAPPAPAAAPPVPAAAPPVPAPAAALPAPAPVVPPVPAAPVPAAAAVSPPEVPSAALPPAVRGPGAVTAPPDLPPAPAGRASSVAGGSAAAAQGLVLSQQPDILRGLLAAALGQHGRQQVSGVPIAQLLTLFSQVIGQAAADADELMYLEQQPDAAESVVEDAPTGSIRSLYADLLGADNLEFVEAAGWEGLD
jgi:hypothetical protein